METRYGVEHARIERVLVCPLSFPKSRDTFSLRLVQIDEQKNKIERDWAGKGKASLDYNVKPETEGSKALKAEKIFAFARESVWEGRTTINGEMDGRKQILQ